ncbi:MAG: M1 family aminopeptidase [Cytophagales bacterium]|nr:M1 family aminopeptidase [Cytophagales bacterium]
MKFVPLQGSSVGHVTLEPGVTQELARMRKESFNSLRYKLSFNIPESSDSLITGENTIYFNAKNAADLVLDFRGRKVLQVSKKGKLIPYMFEKGHIVVSKEHIEPGEGEVTVRFAADDMALNRRKDYMYTLFVPDKASTAFPCFDQPDIKASYSLSLVLPKDWDAMANGENVKISHAGKDGRRRFTFAPTKAISSYLFAFTAGKFQKESRTVEGYEMTFFYKETDSLKLENNVTLLFEEMAHALNWMEEYTGIAYPFQKFDFVALPSFQFGGMEHPGVTYFNERRFFLDSQATKSKIVYRSKLIAHEVAHMWFGNLVTMKWFNEVWLKEVFANFIADKVVNPRFQDIDHQLKFVCSHFPSAYSVDRTLGTHPVQQRLGNLLNAGSIYGKIIYHKAPVAMLKLENAIGKTAMRNGLKEYLRTYSGSNADWSELISILDKQTDVDVFAWSKAWIETEGMPRYKISQTDSALYIGQTNLSKQWPQDLHFCVQRDQVKPYVVEDVHRNMKISGIQLSDCQFVLPNSSGLEYGYFELPDASYEFFIKKLRVLKSPRQRMAAWMNLYEAVANGKISADSFLEALKQNLYAENEALIIDDVLKKAQQLYWNFLPDQRRLAIQQSFANWIWKQIEFESDPGIKSSYFDFWTAIVSDSENLEKAYHLWRGETQIFGKKLSDSDKTSLFQSLLINSRLDTSSYSAHFKYIKNERLIQKMNYLKPVFSADKQDRLIFFQQLESFKNRKNPVWTIEALRWLNHPIRRSESLAYIRPGLDWLLDIQKTHDIFFPTKWLHALLGQHNAAEAKQVVQQFLNTHPNYPQHLRLKILQAADPLYRSAEHAKKNGF